MGPAQKLPHGGLDAVAADHEVVGALVGPVGKLAPQGLLGSLLPRLRELPLAQLAKAEAGARRLPQPQQQTQPQSRARLR